MKLEPKAKPVKIRIKSGGEEHSSLDSLKRNFSVEDLIPLQKDGRLFRWLKQLNEEDLADRIDRIDLKDQTIESITIESYISFLKSFFEGLSDDITEICDKWLQDNLENGVRLLPYALRNGNWNLDRIIELKEEHGNKISVNWLDIFKRYDDQEKLFNIGKMYYEDKNEQYMHFGQELLEMLDAKGNEEAKKLLFSRQNVTEEEIDDVVKKSSLKSKNNARQKTDKLDIEYCQVQLIYVGEAESDVAKIIKHYYKVDIEEAKRIVNKGRHVIQLELARKEARTMINKLKKVGAKAEIYEY